jgi:hypothetical protein
VKRPCRVSAFRRAREALELVVPLVDADLAQHVAEAVERSIVSGDRASARLRVELGMLEHEQRILMLGVVLKVGVKPIRPRRPHEVHEPGDHVVRERDHLRQQPEAEPAEMPAAVFERVLEDEQVPLLVVLLLAGSAHPVIDATCQTCLAGVARDLQVGGVFPRLVRDAGDELEHEELLERAAPPVEQVHRPEQDPRDRCRSAARRCERAGLFEHELAVLGGIVTVGAGPACRVAGVVVKTGERHAGHGAPPR